jgi:hypothetical protein
MKLECDIFRLRNAVHASLFIAHSGRTLQVRLALLLRSVAGFGVRGPSGPRSGNSSGVLPGSSCGCGGAPGSCTGGGISGRGLPGGSSCGGSVGWPGVAGGISGGSIGIADNGADAAKFHATQWPCLRMTSGQTLCVCPEGKPVPTFPSGKRKAFARRSCNHLDPRTSSVLLRVVPVSA